MKMISNTTSTQSTPCACRSARRRDERGQHEIGEPARKGEEDEPRAERRCRRLGVLDHADGDDRTECQVEGPIARLGRHRERGRRRIGDDADRQRAEQERPQSPHATLPSPPTTVSASACAASGQPATTRTGTAASHPAPTAAPPRAATVSGPPTATSARRPGVTAAWSTDVRRPRVTSALGTPRSSAAWAASWSPRPSPVHEPTSTAAASPDGPAATATWASSTVAIPATVTRTGRDRREAARERPRHAARVELTAPGQRGGQCACGREPCGERDPVAEVAARASHSARR